MRHPQLLVYEGDGRLAELLRPTAKEHRWALREPRQLGECLGLLRNGPGVLVLKVGRDGEDLRPVGSELLGQPLQAVAAPGGQGEPRIALAHQLARQGRPDVGLGAAEARQTPRMRTGHR